MTWTPRLPIRAVAAAALVVASVALAPGRATASCGDYVQVGIDPQDSRHQPDPPATPCHGPGCSKAPATPALPLTTPVLSPTDYDQSAAAADPVPASRPASGWSDPPAANVPLARLTSSIFHPPRAG